MYIPLDGLISVLQFLWWTGFIVFGVPIIILGFSSFIVLMTERFYDLLERKFGENLGEKLGDIIYRTLFVGAIIACANYFLGPKNTLAIFASLVIFSITIWLIERDERKIQG